MSLYKKSYTLLKMVQLFGPLCRFSDVNKTTKHKTKPKTKTKT